MKIQTMIMLESGEKYLLTHFNEALNLVGWMRFKDFKNLRFNEVAEEDRDLYLDLKAVNRIRGDQFSMEDCARAEAFIRRLASEIEEQANTAENPFSDEYAAAINPNVNQYWRDGLKGSATLAIRKLESFLEGLRDLMDEQTLEMAA